MKWRCFEGKGFQSKTWQFTPIFFFFFLSFVIVICRCINFSKIICQVLPTNNFYTVDHMGAVYYKDRPLIIHSWLCWQRKRRGVFLTTRMYRTSYKYSEHWQKAHFSSVLSLPRLLSRSYVQMMTYIQLTEKYQAPCRARAGRGVRTTRASRRVRRPPSSQGADATRPEISYGDEDADDNITVSIETRMSKYEN